MRFNAGSSNNFSNKPAKGVFTLHGDPDIKVEKPYTILEFPGGSFELARCSDGTYWAHIALTDGRLLDARIDAAGRYVPNSVGAELAATDFQHLAVRIGE